MSPKKLPLIISDIQFTAVAWNLSIHFILHPSLSHLYLYFTGGEAESDPSDPSKVFQCNDKDFFIIYCNNRDGNGSTPRAISFLPLPPPFRIFQPSGASSQNHRDNLQSSVNTGMGSSKDRTGGWFASCPLWRAHHPVTFISVLEIHLLPQPISQSVISAVCPGCMETS